MFNNIALPNPIPTLFGSGGPSGGGTGASTPRKGVTDSKSDTDLGGDVLMELADEGPPEGLKGTLAERRYVEYLRRMLSAANHIREDSSH